MSSPIHQVLLSPDLSTEISKYQRGVYLDMRTFRCKICPIYDSFYDGKLIRQRMAMTFSLFDPWLNEYGTKRIEKLIQSSLKFKQALIQYVIYYGRLDIVKYFHEKYNLLTFHGPLIDIAALNGQVEMIQYMHSIEHPGETSRGMIWAAEYGHFNVIEYYYKKESKKDWSIPIQVAERCGHVAISNFLRRPKGLIVVHQWISNSCTMIMHRYVQ